MTRATRYPLTLPVRFRVEGEPTWSFGMSLNISHTGILFATDRGVDARRPLEIEVVLPGNDDDGGARIVTRGVIRRATPVGAGREGALAVALTESELVRLPRHE